MTIDCKGMLCPRPLIETKKAIKQAQPGDTLSVVIDNETSCQNVLHFLNDNGVRNSVEQKSDLFTITLTVPEALSNPGKAAEEYCQVSFSSPKIKRPSVGKTIVVIDKDSMGSGNEELGRMLMKGFLNTLPELTPLPHELICYNSGVLLARKGTDTAQSLIDLQDKGVKISLCGTCTDYFGIKEQIAVGNISNMLYIVEQLADADKVIKP